MIKYPVSKPIINNREISTVNTALKTGWISSAGPNILAFENSFSSYLGGGYAVSVSNGTIAIELAIKTFGLKKNDEIIVPNFTFSATLNAVINSGCKPVLADIDQET